ncbi:nitrate- and nitrite sensing domain-containing protein [Streptomyces niveus]|uniref:nitrate- and nitrite sensing domain-containing protein n=1 Tax=Streptomyces niveus TaxID=193462 RepID=UPI00099050A1|nr:nitrate- and nitrite sensing domain-containing protein [Streptomyces niveus]
MTTTPRRHQRAGRARTGLLSVRARLVLVATIAVTALVALMAVNAARDWEQQDALRKDSTTGELGGEASLPLFVGVQAERRLTGVFLADPTKANRAALEKQRVITDEGVASFRHLSGSELEVSQRHKWSYVERVYHELDGLARVRAQADDRAGNSEDVTGYYTGLLVTMIEFYQALSAMDDAQLTAETRALVGLFWASEGLSQQDMLIAQARARGRMSAGERVAFAEAYGAQRVMYERWIAPYLPAPDKAAYERIVAGDAWKTKERVEEALISAPTADASGVVEDLPRELDRWDEAHRPLAQQIGALNLARTQGLLAHGYERADEVRDQVLWQIAGSLAAILAIAALIVWIIRSITRRLEELQATAAESAERLPFLIGRLQQGQQVHSGVEFPSPAERGDEFGGVERALAAASAMTVEIAARQAGDRRGFATFVAATSRRALNLVEGQLAQLAVLEKKYGKDTDLLGDLIGVDHRGSQTRRHLDNLLTLSGAPSEPYTEPRSLASLIDDAAAETGTPLRVGNRFFANVWVRPEAVNDVIHMLAALLDNGLVFSPPSATVRVTGLTAVHGIAVEITDRGTAMKTHEYDRANDRLAAPPTFETMALDNDGRLGLFVVANLALRHECRVALRRSEYGGTTATVLLPHTVLCPQPAVPRQRSTTGRPVPPDQPEQKSPLPSREHAPASEALPVPAGRSSPGAPAAETSPAVLKIPDHDAPSLPRRTPNTHMAPQLTHPVLPDPVHHRAEEDPGTVRDTWGAWQQGTHAAEDTYQQEDPSR